MYDLSMTNTELLKSGRDGLLSLHKSLVDLERSDHESKFGPVTSGQFLNLLLEDESLAWLRKFSALIVEIDEMFAQKDGFAEEAVDLHLNKMRELVLMKGLDETFVSRYQAAVQRDPEVAAKQGELKKLFA